MTAGRPRFPPESLLHSSEVIAENQSKEALEVLAGMSIVVLGIPGAGKTSLAEALQSKNEDITYISLGEISRQLPEGSPERQELDRLFEIGSPVGSAEFFCDLVAAHIDQACEEGKGFILDGIPKKSEETAALLAMLDSKGINLDMVVSCETSPLVAHDRIVDRAERPGDPDTLEIFTNRTARYLTDLDQFKSDLTADRRVPLLVINTEEVGIDEAATRTIDYVQHLINQRDIETDKERAETLLFEAAKQGDKQAIIKLISLEFDDELPHLSHEMLYGENLSPEQKQALVEEAFAEREPELQDTPLFLHRLAENYLGTTFSSLEHLSDSLIEEAANRFGLDYTSDNLQEILAQQRGLKQIIELLQEEVVGDKDLSTLFEEEMQINGSELAHLEEFFKERAAEFGLDPEAISVRDLMNLQPRLWGQLTSNQILFSPDYNYRRASNGVPGSHHSLLPFTKNRRALTATSMGNYVPFVEAVSASEYKYGSTFGFVHFMGMDKAGQAYGAEYPIMMHDQALLDLDNSVLNELLSNVESFYSNHDLWHNLLPVYADHFILHHPDAPLSYGGRLPGYMGFGRQLREEKEEYEIGVAMSHARTQQERFAADPAVREKQEALILGSLDKIPSLRWELEEQCNTEEIEDIIDYLSAMTAKKAVNVFSPGDPIFSQVEAKLDRIGLPSLTVDAKQVASLLWKQGLIHKSNLRQLEDILALEDDDILRRIAEDGDFAKEVCSYVDLAQSDKESGAEHIVAALEGWETANILSGETGSVELSGMEKVRWLAMVSPQREQLKGHMEKVHGKPGYTFGGETVPDARDLVLMQYKSVMADSEHYAYREYARWQNQNVSYRVYSLLFDDSQDMHSGERDTLNYIRHGVNDGALRSSTKTLVAQLDKVMHGLVSRKYDAGEDDLVSIESYAQMLEHSLIPDTDSLASSIRIIVKDYRELRNFENLYQERLGKTYDEAEAALLDEQMRIA
jgi:adenylate kinase